MRIHSFFLTAFVAAVFFSCKSNIAVNESLTGNWLILYPEHRLKTYREREIYGKHQDSLITLYGLKLITLESDGNFSEIDSTGTGGAKWTYGDDSLLKIREGGRGFNPFNASFTSLENDTLRLTQYVPLGGEKIRLVWHLKKIDEENGAALFASAANNWRKKPATSESLAAIQKRLASMLNYYSDYFRLIGKESIYFSPARVPLPFHYYQHAMGMKRQMNPDFKRLFFNEQDAQQAYGLLEQALMARLNAFTRGDNFVTEYGLFLKKLAEWMDEK